MENRERPQEDTKNSVEGEKRAYATSKEKSEKRKTSYENT